MNITTQGYRREVKTYLRYLHGARCLPEKKFVIFGPGRCGSTLLVELLRSHPDITAEDEILHFPVLLPRAYVRCREQIAGSRLYGFKLLTYQLLEIQRVRPRHFLHWLAGSGYRLIYLRRQNLLRHAISNLYARQRQLFHVRSSEENQMDAMTLHFSQLLRWMRGLESTYAQEQKLLAGLSYLELVYEWDLRRASAHQPTADRVFECLGVASMPVQTSMNKATGSSLRQLISNHEEIAARLRHSCYAQYAGEFER